MDFESEEINYYEVIGCTIDSTVEEIGRAVRKLSVKYHPDKNKSPEAPEIFLRIQKSKEFLLDETKRKEYDEKYRKIAKRKEYDAKRYKNMDSRRKRMREELEERLGSARKPASQTASAGPSGSDTTQSEKRRKKAELDRIRKDGIERVRAAASKQQQDHADSIEEISKKLRAREEEQARAAAEAASAVDVYLQIKVKWKRSAESHSDDTLAALFREYGSIEEISLLPGKGASAVITFTEPSAAPAAVRAYETSKDIRVAIYGEPKKASVFTHVYTSANTQFSTDSSSSTQAHFSNNAFMESDIMREVRRTMEREALLRQLESEEEHGESTEKKENGQNYPSSTSSTTTSHHVPNHGTRYTYRAKDMPAGGGTTTLAELKAKEDDILAKMIQFATNKSSVRA